MTKVLDKGFVNLMDVMGDDRAIVSAARVSHGGMSYGDDMRDKRLINYLMKHQHMSPFEMAEMKFHIKAPIFVARQWMRHRAGSFNEMSGRYTQMKDEWYVPDAVRVPIEGNKQGSEELSNGTCLGLLDVMDDHLSRAFETYYFLLNEGMAKEMARMVLPLATYTEFYWKCDLRNILGFLSLRLHEDAQLEVRQYAEAVEEKVAEQFPWTWEAWRKPC